MEARGDLDAFIRSSLRSVWSFEIALLLKRRSEWWTHADIVGALRGSDLVVSQGIENLMIAGLVGTDADGRFAYMPVNKTATGLMGRAERLYESEPREPHAVSRLVPDLPALAQGRIRHQPPL